MEEKLNFVFSWVTHATLDSKIMDLEICVFLKMTTVHQVIKMMGEEPLCAYSLQTPVTLDSKTMDLEITVYQKMITAQLVTKTMEEELNCVFY